MTTHTTAQAPPASIDLNTPYVGWIDHYHLGWQAVLVRVRDGRRVARRLGAETPKDWAVETCQVLADTTGVQIAGELSKQGFVPLAGPCAPCPSST
ncbi:hypothetical protein [Streptosporangium longisporum]|uniref:Uncharacterized protein n=1 Tax=Streptosporangium longisporum TaxID=46187 RepID=A0ABP6LCL1_9ACTN